MPNQPLGVIDLCLYSDSLFGLNRLASEHRVLGSLKLHRDVKPVQNPSPGELAAVHSLAKFASVIADHGDSLVWSHATCKEKLVQPRGRRWHQLMHVRVEPRGAVRKSCTARNDVDMPIPSELLRPRRFQLREIARRLAALRAA